jgi:hypothetical protein
LFASNVSSVEPPFRVCHIPGGSYLPLTTPETYQHHQDVPPGFSLPEELIKPFSTSSGMVSIGKTGFFRFLKADSVPGLYLFQYMVINFKGLYIEHPGSPDKDSVYQMYTYIKTTTLLDQDIMPLSF